MPSEKILEKKKAEVAVLSDALKSAKVGVLVDYKGITVEEDTKLRKELREAGNTYKVVKNTLLGRAFESAGISGLEGCLEGTTAIAYAEEDYVSAAKILSKFEKDVESFSVKGGFIDGSAVDKTQISALSKLPSKEALVAQVVYGFNSPIQGLANVASGTLRSLVLALNAIAEKQSA